MVRCEALLCHLASQERYTDDRERYRLYVPLASRFSERRLSYSQDIIRAFGGILSTLAEKCQWRFVIGMPSHLIQYALLWISAPPAISRNPYFDSWSWAGWIGFKTWAMHNLMAPIWIRREERPLLDLYPEAEINMRFSQQDTTQVFWHTEMSVVHLYVTTSVANASSFKIVDSTISFSEDPQNEEGQVPIFPFRDICTADGVERRILYDYLDESTDDHDFMVSSRFQLTSQSLTHRGRVSNDSFCSWYNHICDTKIYRVSDACLVTVLLVERKESWVERVGIGFIHKDAWGLVVVGKHTVRLR